MSRLRTAGIGVLLIVVAHAWLIAIGVNPLHTGGGWDRLWDPDSYTRILRVQELAAGGRWYDPILHAANYPRGFALHWSRLLDVLLLVPAAIAAIGMPFARALLGWGIALGPVLHVTALLLLWWGTRPFLGGRRFLLLAVLFVAQRGITYDFVPGLVDHHGLQVLLLVASLAALYREPDDPRLAYAAGAAGALALWASVESIVIVLAIVLGLGLQWLLEGRDGDGRRFVRYGVALSATAVVALLCERAPAAALERSYERFSIVQVAISCAVLLAAVAVAGAGRSRLAASAGRRLAIAAAVAAAVAAALLALFPALARNPYGASAPAFRLQMLPQIAAEQLFLPTRPEAAYDFVLEIGPALVGLGWSLVRLLGARAPLAPAERLRYRLSSVAVCVLAAYAVYSYRGVPFVAAAGIVPWAEAVGALWTRAARAWPGGSLRRRIASSAAVIAVAAGPWWVAGSIAALWMPRFRVGNAPLCPWDRVAPHLPQPGAGSFRRAVLTDVFSGPELAFRTGRPVLGAPYQGDGEGIEATYTTLAAGDDAGALLDARGVELVALCMFVPPDLSAVLDANPEGLGARLLGGSPPPGLVALPLPDELAGTFVLYRRETVPAGGAAFPSGR